MPIAALNVSLSRRRCPLRKEDTDSSGTTLTGGKLTAQRGKSPKTLSALGATLGFVVSRRFTWPVIALLAIITLKVEDVHCTVTGGAYIR